MLRNSDGWVKTWFNNLNLIIHNNLYHLSLLVSRENGVIFCLASLKYSILILQNPFQQFNACHINNPNKLNHSSTFYSSSYLSSPTTTLLLLHPFFLSLWIFFLVPFHTFWNRKKIILKFTKLCNVYKIQF